MKYALIGEKLGHSYSKIIHDKYFKYKGIDSTYDLIEIPRDDLTDKIKSMKQEGYGGYNVTIPYKIDVMNMCDEVFDEAVKIGSVNTINFVNGKMLGYNTDYHGLRLSILQSGVEIYGKRAVILGTGGASKAVAALCEDMNCSDITFVSRNARTDLGYRCVTYSDVITGDIIINTTPVGMYPNTDTTPFESFEGFETAIDLIYNPDETLFLKQAKNSGLATVNGLYMLVSQALYAQSIWQGIDPDTELIDKIYEEMRGC